MSQLIAEQVKQQRDLDQILTAIEAKRFSDLETLLMGLNISALALRIAGER
jgi:NAD-dependent DNA ligase